MDTLLKKHSPFLWFVNSFHSYDYKIDYTVNCDREKLEACLQASPALDRDWIVVLQLEDGTCRCMGDADCIYHRTDFEKRSEVCTEEDNDI